MSFLFPTGVSRCYNSAGSSAMNAVNGATITGWINPSYAASSKSQIYIFSLSRNTSGFNRFGIFVDKNGRTTITARCKDTDTIVTVNGTNGDVTENVWSFITAIVNYSTKLCYFYVNGVAKINGGSLSSLSSAPTSATNSAMVSFGDQSASSTNEFQGYLEDIRLYNRVLVANEIDAIRYGQGRDGILQGLKHRYGLIDQPPGVTNGECIDYGPLQLNNTQEDDNIPCQELTQVNPLTPVLMM